MPSMRVDSNVDDLPKKILESVLNDGRLGFSRDFA